MGIADVKSVRQIQCCEQCQRPLDRMDAPKGMACQCHERSWLDMNDRTTAWRPIETAPKDGTVILLGVAWEPLVVVGFWKDGQWVAQWTLEPLIGFEPVTHWQPIEPLPNDD